MCGAIPINQNRYFSTSFTFNLNKLYTKDNSNSELIIFSEGKQIVLSSDFIEWLRGYTDAEGCFLVVKTGNTFAIRFWIKLHVDDVSVLDFIQKILVIGRVTIYPSSAIFLKLLKKKLNFIL